MSHWRETMLTGGIKEQIKNWQNKRNKKITIKIQWER